jgi:hypothetical protein
MPEFEKECFFIAPIGSAGSPERERSDGVLEFIVAPAVEALGLKAVRADQIGQPGQITHQVVEHVIRARGAVADLSGANANVYYELAVRHAARLPVVLIADEAERKRLPFDLNQMRTIFFDHTNLASAARAKDEIVVQLRRALDGAVDSPVSTAVNLQALEAGSRVEQTLADLVARVDQLTMSVSRMSQPFVPTNTIWPGNLGRPIVTTGQTGSYFDPTTTQYDTVWISNQPPSQAEQMPRDTAIEEDQSAPDEPEEVPGDSRS